MKVILLEKVANLGNLGDIAHVKNGYARNFLIPFAKAKRATEKNLKDFEDRRAEYEKKQLESLGGAQARQAQIDGKIFTISAKSGVDGKLFGSVTALDIVDLVKQSGVELKKTEVILSHGPLKNIGEFEVRVNLHHDVVATIRVNVIPTA